MLYNKMKKILKDLMIVPDKTLYNNKDYGKMKFPKNEELTHYNGQVDNNIRNRDNTIDELKNEL